MKGRRKMYVREKGYRKGRCKTYVKEEGFTSSMLYGKEVKENMVLEESKERGAEIVSVEELLFGEQRMFINLANLYTKNPFDILDRHPLVNGCGEFNSFAVVEPFSEGKTNDGKNYFSEKLIVRKRLNFAEFVGTCVDHIIGKTSTLQSRRAARAGDIEQIGSAGHGVHIESTSKGARICATGDGALICCSGDNTQIGSTGKLTRIDSTGNEARIGSSGSYANVSNSGDYVTIASSGDYASISSSGTAVCINASGDGVHIGSTGMKAEIHSSGKHARISSTGCEDKVYSTGDHTVISSAGEGAIIKSSGKHSVVMCSGDGCVVKARKGSFITLTEWACSEKEGWRIPVHVKMKKVDGERIKEDTYYMLKDGEFVEVE